MQKTILRSVAWWLVLIFFLTQTVPAGFAVERARPVSGTTGMPGALEQDPEAQEREIAGFPDTVPAGAYETFVDPNPLSSLTVETTAAGDPVTDPTPDPTPDPDPDPDPATDPTSPSSPAATDPVPDPFVVQSGAASFKSFRGPGGGDTGSGGFLELQMQNLQREYRECLEDKGKHSQCEEYAGKIGSLSAVMQDGAYAGVGAPKRSGPKGPEISFDMAGFEEWLKDLQKNSNGSENGSTDPGDQPTPAPAPVVPPVVTPAPVMPPVVTPPVLTPPVELPRPLPRPIGPKPRQPIVIDPPIVIKPPIVIRPPVMPPIHPPAVTPPPVLVVTDPKTGKQLSVKVNKDGTVTVKWGDEEYTGSYDPRTRTLTVLTRDGAIWTLQFAKNKKGKLYFQTFQVQRWNQHGHDEETYRFNDKGQLTGKDWLHESFAFSCDPGNASCGYEVYQRSGGSLDYAMIDGKLFVWKERNWSYSGPNIYASVDYENTPSGSRYRVLPYPDEREREFLLSPIGDFTSSETIYDQYGNILAETHENNSGGFYSRKHVEYTYVRIGDHFLVSSKKTTQRSSYNGIADVYFPTTQQYTEEYFRYDETGKRIVELKVWRDKLWNVTVRSGGEYRIYDAAHDIWWQASCGDPRSELPLFTFPGRPSNGADLTELIDSWEDFTVIDQYAEMKTGSRFQDPNGEGDPSHVIYYYRNRAGVLQARAMLWQDGSGSHVDIVIGEPDLISSEKNDKFFVDTHQTVNGYEIELSGVRWDKLQQRKIYGWLMVFKKDGEVVATADFPEESVITLNGRNYLIEVDKDGNILLNDALQRYYDQLAELRQFMSGILLSGFTPAQLNQMLGDLAELKTLLETVLAQNKNLDKELRAMWDERWAEFDKILSTRPVLVQIGSQTVEFLLSDLKTVLDDEYTRIASVGTYDFIKLPGISSADLQGLQKLADYLAGRMVGSQVNVPVFNMLSPVGYMTLLVRLVEKYGQDVIGVDKDNDGYAEVDLAIFRRMVNGTELAYRQAKALISSMIARHNIQFPSYANVSFEVISGIASQLAGMSRELKSSLAELINQFSGEAAFKQQLMTEVQTALNLAYDSYARNWTDLLSRRNIVFTVPGIGPVTVSYQQLNELAGYLPRDIATLMRYPGIHEGIGEAFLRTLETYGAASARAGICLSCVDASTPDELSDFAVRIQLVARFLSVQGSAVLNSDNTAVVTDKFKDRLLLNDNLRTLLANAQLLIDQAIEQARLLAGDVSQGITMQVYESLLALIRSTNTAVTDVLRGALNDVIYSTQYEITRRLQERFNQLNAAVDNIFAQAKVRIVINGRSILVDPKTIQSVIQQLLPLVAVSWYGEYNREQYGRLNGITLALLSQLRSSAEINYYRSISFGGSAPVFTTDPNQMPDVHEMWFSLVPRVLESFGEAILDENGVISLSKVREQFLTGVNMGVNTGKFPSILAAYRDICSRWIVWGRTQIQSLDFSVWEQRKLAEGILRQAITHIQEEALPMIQLLNANELGELNGIANSENNNGLYNLMQLIDQKRRDNPVVKLTLPGGQQVEINLHSVVSIQGFPSGVNYPRDLFPGLVPEDFNGTERNSVWSMALSKSGVSVQDPLTGDSLTLAGQEQLAIQAIVRMQATLGQIPELFRNALFKQVDGVLVLNVETFRRLIKGVDLLHNQIVQQTNVWIQEVLVKIRELMQGAMTIEKIKQIYSELTALQAKIISYMDGLTAHHEKTDVMEMEEAVTGNFQTLFAEFFDYIQSHELVWTYQGRQFVLPVNAIRDRILSYLKERFPGEDIGAHHFAYLIGVTMQDVRGFDKLENFLGSQIIALPRNSAYIEIVSKLSEIGMLELIVTMIERFAKDIADPATGTINMNQLMELLTNQDLAVQRAKAEADRIADLVRTRLQAILQGGKLTPELLAEVFKLVKDARSELVNTLNDFVVGFDKAHFDAVQEHLTSLYADLRTLRDSLVEQLPIEITARGGLVFTVHLSQIVPVIAEQIKLLLSQMPPEREPVPIDYFAYKLDDLIATTGLLTAAESSVADLGEAYFCDPGFGKYRPDGSDQGLSEYGFMTLVVRLITKYGSFVVDENHQFSLEKFLYELGRSDKDRTAQIFQEIKASGLARLSALIPLDPNTPITLEQLVQIHALLDQLRKEHLEVIRLYGEENGIDRLGNASWSSIMDAYEAGLFSRSLQLTLRGQVFTVNVKALVDIIFEEYGKGVSEFLKRYADGGETEWGYSDYRTLVPYRYQWGVEYDRWGYEWKRREDPQGPYPFTVGDLARIPGISSTDLEGLDLFEDDPVSLTFAADAIELLRGMFNLRVLSPGSGIQMIGDVGIYATASFATSGMAMKVTEAAYVSRDALLFEPYIPWYWFEPRLSTRDLMFRVVPAILEDYFDTIFHGETEVDLDVFRDLLHGEVVDVPRLPAPPIYDDPIGFVDPTTFISDPAAVSEKYAGIALSENFSATVLSLTYQNIVSEPGDFLSGASEDEESPVGEAGTREENSGNSLMTFDDVDPVPASPVSGSGENVLLGNLLTEVTQ